MRFQQALQHSFFWRSLSAIAVFAVNLLLVRLLGAAGSGSFLYAIAWLSLLTLILSISLESGLVYTGHQSPESVAQFSWLLVGLLLVQALLTSLVLWLQPLGVTWWWGLGFVMSQLVIVYASALYTLQRRFGWMYAIPALVQVALALLLWARHQGWMAAVGRAEDWYLAGSLVTAAGLGIGLVGRLGWIWPRGSSGWLKQLFTFAGLALTSNLLFFLVLRADYYFVHRFCDDVALGNYVQVSRLGQLLLLPAGILAGVVFPYAASRSSQADAASVLVIGRALTVLYVLVFLFFAAFGYWLFPWLFGPAFSGMYAPLLLAFPGYICLGWLSVTGAFVSAQGNQAVHVRANLLAVGVVVLGDWFLIPLGGILAAAAVSTLAYAIAFVWVFRAFQQHHPISFTDLWRFEREDFQKIRALVSRSAA